MELTNLDLQIAEHEETLRHLKAQKELNEQAMSTDGISTSGMSTADIKVQNFSEESLVDYVAKAASTEEDDGDSYKALLTKQHENLRRRPDLLEKDRLNLSNFSNVEVQPTPFASIAPTGDGQLLLPYGLFRSSSFWKIFLTVGALSIVLALVNSLFIYIMQQVYILWVPCGWLWSARDQECGEYFGGEWWWILVIGFGGFLNGSLAWYWQYPEDYSSILYKLNTYKSNLEWGAKTMMLGLISLSLGASLSPVALFFDFSLSAAYEVSKYIKFASKQDLHLLVLGGTAGGMGSVLPSPILSTTLVFEIDRKFPDYMKGFVITTFGAICAWLVLFSISNNTPIIRPDYSGTTQRLFSLQWDNNYHNWQNYFGAFLGFIGATIFVGVYFIMLFTDILFKKLRGQFPQGSFARYVLPNTIGGMIIGLLSWMVPLALSKGHSQIGWTYSNFGVNQNSFAYQNTSFQAVSMLVKAVNLGISGGCGFKGGVFFGILDLGREVGVILYSHYPIRRGVETEFQIPIGMAVACIAAGTSAALIPTPIFWLLYFVFFMSISWTQAVSVTVAILTSYCVVSGSGLFHKFQMIAIKKKFELLKQIDLDHPNENEESGSFKPELPTAPFSI